MFLRVLVFIFISLSSTSFAGSSCYKIANEFTKFQIELNDDIYSVLNDKKPPFTLTYKENTFLVEEILKKENGRLVLRLSQNRVLKVFRDSSVLKEEFKALRYLQEAELEKKSPLRILNDGHILEKDFIQGVEIGRISSFKDKVLIAIELQKLEQTLKEKEVYISDLHSENIVFNKETGKIHIIDQSGIFSYEDFNGERVPSLFLEFSTDYEKINKALKELQSDFKLNLKDSVKIAQDVLSKVLDNVEQINLVELMMYEDSPYKSLIREVINKNVTKQIEPLTEYFYEMILSRSLVYFHTYFERLAYIDDYRTVSTYLLSNPDIINKLAPYQVRTMTTKFIPNLFNKGEKLFSQESDWINALKIQMIKGDRILFKETAQKFFSEFIKGQEIDLTLLNEFEDQYRAILLAQKP